MITIISFFIIKKGFETLVTVVYYKAKTVYF